MAPAQRQGELCVVTHEQDIDYVADLAVTKTVNDRTPSVGDEVIFTVVVTNKGPSTSRATTVTDQLPSGYTYVSHTASVGTYNPDPASGVWQVGALAKDATATLTITAKVNARGVYTNVATVEGSPDDTDPVDDNNTDEDTVDPVKTIQAVPDDYTNPPYNGAVGGTTSSVLGNDLLNGELITDQALITLKPGNSPHSGLSMNTDGTITVAAGTPAGTYEYPYEICDADVATLCSSTIATVRVVTIDAVNETFGPFNGAVANANVGNALTGDTLNGVAATLDTVNLSLVTGATSIGGGLVPSLDVSTGVVSLPAGTPAGTYEITYRICDKVNPDVCDTAVLTVLVVTIDAVDDTYGSVNGTTGVPNVGNVLANDTLNGAQATIDTVTIRVDAEATPVVPGAPVPVLDPATGMVSVPAGTPAGSYTITYEICDTLNPGICDTAVVTVNVDAPEIVAVNETFGPFNGAVANANVGNALNGDTLNGQQVSIDTVTIAVLTPATPVVPGAPVPVIDPATGVISVPPGTPAGSYPITYEICDTLNRTNCDSATITVEVIAPVIEAIEDEFGPINGDEGSPNVGNVLDNDTLNGVPVSIDTVTLNVITPATPVRGGPVPSIDPATGIVSVPANTPAGEYVITYQICETRNPTNCATTTVTVKVDAGASELYVTKLASTANVRVGDMVRYTVSIENRGLNPVTDAQLVDTPPAGFSYVDGSLDAAGGRLAGRNPLVVDQLNIPVGGTVLVSYLMRAGAGVAPGLHTNRAHTMVAGQVVSNEASATVRVVGDPMLDESLIVGTVFHDRDGDGWQDQADVTGLRVQGGFAADVYIANSTSVNRGEGAVAQADRSSPLLRGIDLGELSARRSEGDVETPHQITVRQVLREPRFTDDFVLDNDQGYRVRMDAAGNTTVERHGDAAKGTTAAEVTVSRVVSRADNGYVVDYVITNVGLGERGIPGVRVASVEGLLMETDQYGRFHLVGVDAGSWARGRNVVLKVDPATLPPGATFTTDNPLLRRVTPGLPVRFDFGVQLPQARLHGGTQDIEVKLGEVFFTPGSAEVQPQYLPAVEEMAAQVRRYGAGEVIIAADAEEQLLAFERAYAVRQALQSRLTAQQLGNLRISVRTQLEDPSSTVVGFQDWPLLGTVLFDTDKSDIRPEFVPMLRRLAAVLEEMDSTRVQIVGHADIRATPAYNQALGMRRATAVQRALAAYLSPEARQRLRVDSGELSAPTSRAAAGDQP